MTDIRTAINDLVQKHRLSDRAAALLLIEQATQYLARVRAGSDSNGLVNAAAALNEAYYAVVD